MTDKLNAGKLVGLATAVLILGGLVLWGVPYYIASIARAQVTTEIAALPPDPHPITAVEVGALTTKVENTEATVLRIEKAMIARDAVILKYFQDKAGEADGT